ncbi:hypothetical protein BJY01DRAFT_260991 [Aspergillus pseudoustus]|uniref:Uncharacterized protein n=1 Tax=Aspergillus pseudoustus TaxID=1810923 RepID=A0ABR4IR78_9EURO
MSDHSKYTVGWIGGLRVEAVAAQALLDEEHSCPAFVEPHDSNSYLLGLIAGHNVIVTLPLRRDSWLGNIVIGVPRDLERGVFEYDFGTTVQGKKIQVRRSLNQPPIILRSGVAAFRREYTVKSHCIQNEVHAVLERYPGRKDEFQRPPPGTDRLFKPTIIYNTNSKLHENCLVKKVLCFEMLAAGIVNHFPCLAIWEICNYAGSTVYAGNGEGGTQEIETSE